VNRVDILGIGVDDVEPGGLVAAVDSLMNKGGGNVAYANVHVVNQALSEPALGEFLRDADLVYCDGNGVRLGARILGQALPARMTGADLIWDLAAAAEGRWRIFWLGGEPGVSAAAVNRLLERHPGLVMDSDHGFHEKSGPDDHACIERINAFEPDILLVGMGTPEQEQWIAERRSRLNARVVWCLGATADVVSGAERRGPSWLTGRAEWIARLVHNPQRMWRRYLVGNPAFLMRVVAARLSRQ
jgi:N-acetylglucosaminyldiphosphoundecaprenol N-acetyl-beta-D-mannosaminyltransferase